MRASAVITGAWSTLTICARFAIESTAHCRWNPSSAIAAASASRSVPACSYVVGLRGGTPLWPRRRASGCQTPHSSSAMPIGRARQRAQGIEHIGAEAIDVRHIGIRANPEAIVAAPPDMLRELSVQPGRDRPNWRVGVDMNMDGQGISPRPSSSLKGKGPFLSTQHSTLNTSHLTPPTVRPATR